MVPTPVSTLWTSLQQQMREGEEGTVGGVTDDGGLFRTVLNQLIADGEVKGSLRGGNAVYTPAVRSLWLLKKLYNCHFKSDP